jgi:hypothetical protein
MRLLPQATILDFSKSKKPVTALTGNVGQDQQAEMP